MKKILLPILLLFSFSPAHALLLHQESFEQAPGGTYTLTTAFDDGGFDYFNRYAVPDNGNAARDDFQTGWDGGFGIQAQDIDGDGGSRIGAIGLTGINVAGFTGLQVTISLGALNSEPAFNNFEQADGDGIKIFVRLDGGADTLIGQFAPPATNGNSGDLYLDTDFNAVGDAARLSIALSDFTFLIPSVGSILDVRVELTSTDSFESLAVDNVRIDSVPEPAMLALLGFGLAFIGYRVHRSNRAA
ncbi:MAG: PEP-CTERM sorting domain-containing protein [Gammaproteobacteria bacterium]|nr:PEP-CTERM sorting domain-containing protein [Gammaproteobacteria bacterium]